MRIILAALFALAASGAAAKCMKSEVWAKLLTEDFGESLVAQGVALDEATVFEFYANDKRGTWTVLVTMPNGTSCLAATGGGWVRFFMKPNL